MMDVHAYAQETSMPIVLVADAVRASRVGDEVRVHTDVEALISDMRAFAHMSGNAVDRVEPRARVTVDLFENGEHVFSPDARTSGAVESGWVIVLKVLPTNRLGQS
jgi:TusA-related sulfurtransferase